MTNSVLRGHWPRETGSGSLGLVAASWAGQTRGVSVLTRRYPLGGFRRALGAPILGFLHLCSHVCVHVYECARVHVCVHVYECARVYVCVNVWVCERVHVCVNVWACRSV